LTVCVCVSSRSPPLLAFFIFPSPCLLATPMKITHTHTQPNPPALSPSAPLNYACDGFVYVCVSVSSVVSRRQQQPPTLLSFFHDVHTHIHPHTHTHSALLYIHTSMSDSPHSDQLEIEPTAEEQENGECVYVCMCMCVWECHSLDTHTV
jgi:hypothetical protein